MSGFFGRTFRLLYNLRHHVWGGITLNTWWISLLLVLALLFYFGVLPGGMGLTVVVLALILVLVLSQLWANHHLYVWFVEAAKPAPEVGSRTVLGSNDKVLLRASGVFSVEGDEKCFTDLIAYYRTFDTREHAIMARQTPSRFLGLGRSKSEMLGMWYIFFMPENLNTVTPGRVYFGGTPNPALRLDYVRINPKGKTKDSVVYLSFETELSMQQVLADLLLDMRGALTK